MDGDPQPGMPPRAAHVTTGRKECEMVFADGAWIIHVDGQPVSEPMTASKITRWCDEHQLVLKQQRPTNYQAIDLDQPKRSKQ